MKTKKLSTVFFVILLVHLCMPIYAIEIPKREVTEVELSHDQPSVTIPRSPELVPLVLECYVDSDLNCIYISANRNITAVISIVNIETGAVQQFYEQLSSIPDILLISGEGEFGIVVSLGADVNYYGRFCTNCLI